ncbi:MAG: sulfatase-like hydrolase/transferase [Planctomycetes bacterium]|nr:sulfatase-like hydrolase/transferase [Planctomycetota bacterium]
MTYILSNSPGQKVVTTPNIDRLAAEGMRFTNHYGGTFCAPSRYSLATGVK